MGSAMAAAARAFASSSALNDEVTHDRRLSQLQPREGHDARSSFIELKSADQRSPPKGPFDIAIERTTPFTISARNGGGGHRCLGTPHPPALSGPVGCEDRAGRPPPRKIRPRRGRRR